MIALNTTPESDHVPIPSGFVGLLRFLGDVAPPAWTEDAFLVEIHDATSEHPEPVAAAYVVDDGSSVEIVAVLVPAAGPDVRVRMLHGAVRDLFPNRVLVT